MSHILLLSIVGECEIPELLNGNVVVTGNATGDTATFSCDEGFQLIGSDTATCTQVSDGCLLSLPLVQDRICRRKFFLPPIIITTNAWCFLKGRRTEPRRIVFEVNNECEL